MNKKNQSGFSLIELMVAMVVTLIVTGAIYGLVAGGQTAFRREPELTDRQQNTRIAMAMIEADIQSAGLGLPEFTQVFTPGLDGVGPNGEDELELLVGVANCPNVSRVCLRTDAAPLIQMEVPVPLPACFLGGGVQLAAAVFAGPPARAVVGPLADLGGAPVCNPPAVTGGPSPIGSQVTIQFDAGPPGWRTFGTAGAPLPGTRPDWLTAVQVVRYRIAPDPNDPTNPNDPNFRHLWRSATGGRTAADNNFADDVPGTANGTWQLVARGINDMQVLYLDGDAMAAANPLGSPQVIDGPNQWGRVVRQATVTLSSRVAGASIAGFTGTDLTDPAQIRLGQLTSQFAPRTALVALQKAAGTEQWK
jgi:prepilin-type N-terminal cleavage/methylation domain-containing protein